MEKVRIGLVGCGGRGIYITSLFNSHPQCEVTALMDRFPARAQAAGATLQLPDAPTYCDFDAMLREAPVDALFFACPPTEQVALACRAMEQGKHVLVEKPMDLTTSGCQSMVSAAEKNNLLLQVDFHKRYDPNNIDARKRVQAGSIGNLQYAYAYMEDKIIVPSEWLAGWAAQSSPFWFIGVHKYDLVRWITGREAISVSAHGRKGKLESMGIDTFDSVSASILMEGSLTCTIDVNWILPKSFEAVVNQGFRLVGSEGIIEVDAQDRGLRYCFSSEGNLTPNFGAIFTVDTVFGVKAVSGYFVDPIKDFLINVRFLKEGGTLDEIAGRYPSGRDGLRVTQVAEAVQESITEGHLVEL